MNIVIDTSAIIAVIANEPEKKRLIKLTSGFDLIAPKSIYWEIGNAFSAMFKRKRATLKQAKDAINIFKKIPIRFSDVDLIDTLELSNKYDIYAYDAYVISCALKHKCSLISLDLRLLEVSKQAKVKIVEV
ncbi:MAG: type II toxin-antitoxin system VapC family toxin [Deltaproteobacteria bacterium]|nr:type II toxin-antitoxin system VapC family toxin [Deltaproteobacteria bacterium]